jgi:hypothetical protein
VSQGQTRHGEDNLGGIHGSSRFCAGGL